MYTARRMLSTDANALVELSQSIGWHIEAENWLLMTELFPEHCFVAVNSAGKLIGSAAALVYGEKRLAWISMVMVSRNCRRLGIASALTKLVMESVSDCETIALDASTMGEKLYTGLGFKPCEKFVKLLAPQFEFMPGDETLKCQNLDENDLDEVYKLDSEVFGVDRSALLKRYFDYAPHYAFKVGKKITGFNLSGHGTISGRIGPVIAKDPMDAAKLIVSSAAANPRRAITIDIPEQHKGLLQFLQSRGFEKLDDIKRMFVGKEPPVLDVNRYFGIFGSNLG